MGADTAEPDVEEDRKPHDWVLSPAEFEATQERAVKINDRAVRRGFTGRIKVSGTPREVTETDEAGLERIRLVFDTTVTGEAPCYNGWRFLAAVDAVPTDDGCGFVLRTAPGADASDVDRSRLVAGRCEHCNTTRARRHTYLVRNIETDTVRQVGSSCIRDFTGWEGRPVFLSEDEVTDRLREEEGHVGVDVAGYSPATVVAAAWAISRKHGWVPAAAGGTCTRDRVSGYLYGTSEADRAARRDLAPEVAAAAGMGQTIITALLEGLDGDSDYAVNLATCLRAAYVSPRHLGIVVSAVTAYERLTGEHARRKAEARQRAQEAARSEYAGTIGEKITLTGTITRLLPVTNTFHGIEVATMLVIVQADTATAKMFTGAAWAWDVQQGDMVTITGTVKAHEDYHDVKQTVLTRPKLTA